MNMDSLDVRTMRLWTLAEQVCKNIRNAYTLRIENSAENSLGNKKVLYIRWEDQEIIVSIANTFLDVYDDDVVRMYLVWSIMACF
jgi:hypothetical protein